MSDKQPPGITVDGEEFQLPTMGTITLDEERVLYVYADCIVRDFIPAHPDATEEEAAAWYKRQVLRTRDPNFKKALAHIALLRADPEMSDADLQRRSGRANALEVDIAMLWSDADDPPTSSQQQPESERNTSEDSRLTDSGSSTKNGSEQADENPESIGTSALGTSSPGAPRIELVN